MLISNKQHEANCKNAQQSSGPITIEGKAAVRLNAVTHGLRARTMILSTENAADYDTFWNQFVDEWRPEGPTERLYLETAVTSQWLLARVAKSERRIYEELNIEFDEKQFRLLALVVKQRTQLERSFRTAILDLKTAQKERQAQSKVEPKVQPAEAANKPVESPAQPIHAPAYVMAEPTAPHPIYCSPIDPDTR